MGYEVRIHVIKDTVEFPYNGILGHEFSNQTGAIAYYRTKKISIDDSQVHGKVVYKIIKDLDVERELQENFERSHPTSEKLLEEDYQDHLLQFYQTLAENIFEGQNAYKNYSTINHIAEKHAILDTIKKDEILNTLYNDNVEEYLLFPLQVAEEGPGQIDVDFEARDIELPDDIKKILDCQERCEYIRTKLKTVHLQTQEEHDHVSQLIEAASDRFYIEGDEFKGINYAWHRIRLQDDYPVQVASPSQGRSQ